MKTGKVYLVGAGPGDPGLLTLKGRSVLEKADVVIYDALVSPRLLRFARADAELILVGKRGGKESIPQDEIDRLLLDRVRQGKQVVRLKGGDPFIFGRGGEEALMLVNQGFEFEVIPGVSSAIAAPAYAGIPLTHRDFTSTVAFVTGHEDLEKETSQIDWAKISTGAGTLVFLMGFSRLEKIVSSLIEHGRSPKTPCAGVMWGTLAKQKTVVGELSNIVQRVKDSGLASPSVFVVGEVVQLREKLQWFERGPLFGKRILVTRSREQASTLVEGLEKLGAEAIEFPTIRIAEPEEWGPVDRALDQVGQYDWIVFTSVNGVNIFLERLRVRSKDIRDLVGVKIAGIGDMTKKALEDRLLKVALSPSDFVAESLLEEFKKLVDLRGKRFLLPRAEQARTVLPQGLRELGAVVDEVVLYRTLPDSSLKQGDLAQDLLKDIHWVTFTSSSTVNNFVRAVGDRLGKLSKNFKVASIGPITSDTVRRHGMEVDLEAKTHTIPGLIETLINDDPTT